MVMEPDDPQVLNALGAMARPGPEEATISPMSSEDVRPGMVIARDVVDSAGRLLVGLGSTVTPALVDHMSSWRRTDRDRGTRFREDATGARLTRRAQAGRLSGSEPRSWQFSRL